jgi:drug/metabolite transporter (DMT)-like permease
MMGAWMLIFTRPQLIASFVHWRGSIWAGFFGALATVGWFTAFTLNSVASVRAVGQIELLISLGVSLLWFREKTNLTEALAIIMLTVSIIMVLMGS